ncbi:MAG: hypothetical protein ACREPK_04730, partial [Rhodanobacteraceae bacterium]
MAIHCGCGRHRHPLFQHACEGEAYTRPPGRCRNIIAVRTRARETRLKIRDMNWSQVEDYLKRDDRAVLP